MFTPSCWKRVVVVALALWAIAPALAQVPALSPVPATLPADHRDIFQNQRDYLDKRWGELERSVKAHNAKCGSVPAKTPAADECRNRMAALQNDINTYIQAVNAFNGSLAATVAKFAAAPAPAAPLDPASARIINSMNALAARLGWGAEERARLDRALRSLRFDGDPNATSGQIARTWQGVLARDGAELARLAARGDGPGYPGAAAGTQSFEDCAVFALANAAGLPYGVVAARAAELIRQGDWRNAAARANPQATIEQQGLIGGEVVMLAEAFGRAEIVSSTDFARTLRDGRRVTVNVTPQSGNVNSGHQVVLSKTFQNRGETWYEMIDSNQAALRRLYLSANELNTILQENGIAFRADPGRTPKILR